VYARFVAPDYFASRAESSRVDGGGEIRAGDKLLVYLRGHDVARVELTAGCRSVDVALLPASRKCVIDLQGAEEEDLRFQLVWTLRIGRVLRDHYREEVRGTRIPVRIPRGVRADVTVQRRGLVIWPRRAPLPEQGDLQLRCEQPWRPTLRIDVTDRPMKPTELEFFPDFLVRPPGPAARTDAWRAAVNQPWWGRTVALGDGRPLWIAPAVPLHAVATVGGRTVVRRVEPGAKVVDLRDIALPIQLPALPLVDGRPAPSGSFILPGRLDVATAAAFLDVRHSHPHLALLVAEIHPQKGQPRSLALAPSDWLTVWHPERGLAHLRWTKDAIPQGRRFPGTMVIRAPGGWVLEGTIAAYPIWRGSGAVKTIPPDNHLQREFDRVPQARYRGVRPGWHAFDIHVDLVQDKTGRRHRVDHTHEVELPAAHPHMEFRLHAPDRRVGKKPQ
jgi:hypothetical protein